MEDKSVYSKLELNRSNGAEWGVWYYVRVFIFIEVLKKENHEKNSCECGKPIYLSS